MNRLVIAAVDIGSNAARLLIKSPEKDQEPGSPVSFYKELFLRIPLRLGSDVFKIGKISDEKLLMMVHMMKSFKQLMRTYGVSKYRVCATSAMREARNMKKVVKTVEQETGMKIDVISGEEEANIVYDKRIEGFEKNLDTYAYVDVGGGSTEVIIVSQGQVIYEKSFKVGTLRLLNEECQEANAFAMDEMKTIITGIAQKYESIDIIGSGGNINKLFKLAANKDKKNSSFTIKSLTDTYNLLKPLTAEERITAYSLRRERADVIVPAAEIFILLATAMKSKRIYVPMLGLADGIIDDLYSKMIAK